jgi:dephospho-CoA kinase
VRTAIDAMKHLEAKGHTHVTMIVGSDRVAEFRSLLSKYRTKEFPGIKKVEVRSAGSRDPDAEGAEGESASKHRALVAAGKRDEFINKYSDKKLGAQIHDALKKGMQMESTTPIGIFLLGGPGSGKDYVLNNIFSRFDLIEVHIDQIINGRAHELVEKNANIVINGVSDTDKISLVKNILEGYNFDYVYVNVTNKVSRERNAERQQPLSEDKRLEKWYQIEKLSKELDCFVFNNSINLIESSEMEKILFGSQIEKLLERIVSHGLQMMKEKTQKSFKDFIGEATNLPGKYKTGNPKTDAARAAHWKKMSKYSDRDPRAYKDAPGDKKARKEGIPLSPHTVAVRAMMAKEETVAEGAADSSLAAKAKKSGVSLSILKKVYKRGVAAWNSGHRPGTTPQQWGHARVNSYINKGTTYRTADKDLREDINNSIDEELFNSCCPEINEEPVDTTPSMTTKKSKKKMTPGDMRKSELDGLPVASFLQYEAKMKEMPVPRQVPAPPGGHPVPPGYERVKSWGGAWELRKIKDKPTTVKEAVEYHVENQISFTDNIFRPASEMFFEMIEEAKKLYKEGKYTPADEFEIDMLESDIGEIADYEGQLVVLDYPIEEGLEECWTGYTQKGMKKKGNKMVPNCVPVNEEDKTDGKGIGKPWREGGGGAVYVRTGDGGVKKVRFSQSGMAKKFNDPGATKSFVARHHCLTNKDKTSASYWACRYPRFFSNSGKIWW